MSKKMDSLQISIGKYLQPEESQKFIIPEFQRPYSWTIENCDLLIEDINSFLDGEKGSYYYFGAMVINKEDNVLSIIDGQQRTITFILLLKALLIKINEICANDNNNKKARNRRADIINLLYGISKDNISDTPCEDDIEIYKNYKLIENKSISEPYKDDLNIIMKSKDLNEARNNVSEKKYKKHDNKYSAYFRNFKFFCEEINKIKTPERVTFFVEKLLNDCNIIKIECAEFEQAIDVFNSLNSKGLPLTDPDIITSSLYANCKNEEERKAFDDKWQDLLKSIQELEKNNICDLNSLLMQHMYYLRAKNGDTGEDGSNVTTPGLRKYYLEKNKKILLEPICFCKSLSNIANKWLEIQKVPLLKLLLMYNENVKLFLSSYLYRFIDQDIPNINLEVILSCMLRLFVVLELVDKPFSSTEFKIFLFKEQKKLIDNYCSEGQISEHFNAHIKKFWLEEKTELKNRIIESNKKILVYLNEFLFAKEKHKKFDIPDKCDIEHIMPSSGKDIEAIRKNAEIENKEDFNQLVNQIGNKILLDASINRSLGHSWFETKLKGYKTCIEKEKNYPIAKSLVETYTDINNPVWNKNKIIDASNRAANRIIRFIFND